MVSVNGANVVNGVGQFFDKSKAFIAENAAKVSAFAIAKLIALGTQLATLGSSVQGLLPFTAALPPLAVGGATVAIGLTVLTTAIVLIAKYALPKKPAA